MFYDKFLELCNQKNKTPSVVADELGFARSSITKWKSGATLRSANLKRVSDYFGVPVSYFSEEDQETEKSPGQMTEAELDSELIEIWKSGDENEHKALLEMARLIKSRRRTK